MPQLTVEQLAKLAGKHSKRTASDVKVRWRDIVEEANAYGEVIVTNHNRPEVVVVSIDQYAKLRAEASANDPLTKLRAEFDRELAVLRTADSSRKLRQVFASTPESIATAASSSRRKR
jgi:prevent-host-death family protein